MKPTLEPAAVTAAEALAREQAAWLGLAHERVFTGLDPFLNSIPTQVLQWRN